MGNKNRDTNFYRLVLTWFGFSIAGQPAINGVELTSIINAGVVWSLPYEWFLYFCLPILSILIFKKLPDRRYLLISVLFIVVFSQVHSLLLEHMLSFVGGAVAPMIIKCNKKKINFKSIYFSTIAVACLFFIFQFDSSSNVVCKLLITIFFTIIALGNSLFGVLGNKTLKFLGEISYSTYLLHGIVIFVTIYYGVGLEEAKQLSPIEFRYMIFMISPLVILISFGTYKLIEKRFMKTASLFVKKEK